MKLKFLLFIVSFMALTAFLSLKSSVQAANPWIPVAIVGEESLKRDLIEGMRRQYAGYESTGAAHPGSSTLDFLGIPSSRGLFDVTFTNVTGRDTREQISVLESRNFHSVVFVYNPLHFESASPRQEFALRKSELIDRFASLVSDIKNADQNIQVCFVAVMRDLSKNQVDTYTNLLFDLRARLEHRCNFVGPYQRFATIGIIDDEGTPYKDIMSSVCSLEVLRVSQGGQAYIYRDSTGGISILGDYLAPIGSWISDFFSSTLPSLPGRICSFFAESDTTMQDNQQPHEDGVEFSTLNPK